MEYFDITIKLIALHIQFVITSDKIDVIIALSIVSLPIVIIVGVPVGFVTGFLNINIKRDI